jgi:hypothetical protein
VCCSATRSGFFVNNLPCQPTIVVQLLGNGGKILYTINFVRGLSPPKPAGLDPPNFCRHTPNWLRNHDSPKNFDEKLEKKI